jgi:hypothetical protein
MCMCLRLRGDVAFLCELRRESCALGRLAMAPRGQRGCICRCASPQSAQSTGQWASANLVQVTRRWRIKQLHVAFVPQTRKFYRAKRTKLQPLSLTTPPHICLDDLVVSVRQYFGCFVVVPLLFKSVLVGESTFPAELSPCQVMRQVGVWVVGGSLVERWGSGYEVG